MRKLEAFFLANFAIDTALTAALFVEITAKGIDTFIPFFAIFTESNVVDLTSFFINSAWF